MGNQTASRSRLTLRTMVFRPICVALIVAACVLGFAQEGKLGHKKQTSTATLSVTQAEVSLNVLRLEKAIRRAIGIGGDAKAISVADPKKPATRQLILDQIERLFELSKPTFKFTPKMIQFDKAVLVVPAGHPKRASLEKLIGWGVLSRVSPLATSKKDALSLQEFGEALGTLASRVADLSHTPSSRWSPYLGG